MTARIEIRLTVDAWRAALREDVRAGLAATPKSLPPKYFYDEAGGALFDRICDLPEYYLTRAEAEILETHGTSFAKERRTLVEFGAGSALKTRHLLGPDIELYIPIDVSEAALRATAARYPERRVHAIVADFTRPLESPKAERRLIAFLGSSIGNFDFPDAVNFLRGIAGAMTAGDRFLLGTDLVKATSALNAAYNDAAGVTAEFNRNILRVVNRHVGTDFDPAAFDHRAYYDVGKSRIEMHLVSRTAQTVRVKDTLFSFEFAAGEPMLTEISCKYTPARVESMLTEAGLRLLEWHEDAAGRFALSLSKKA